MLNLKIGRRPRWVGFDSAQVEKEGPQRAGGRSEADHPSASSIPKLRNIVSATDLSLGGTTAIMAGADVAERSGAQLSVVSIVEPHQYPDLLHAAEPGIAEWVDSQQDRIRRSVERELERADLRDALVHVSVGDPARLVAAFTHKLQSSLLVIGAHRLSKFERVVAGSAGEEILRHSGCPVMIATRNGGAPYKRILVAVDLSGNSKAVLDTAVSLAQCDNSGVQVVYSEEPWKNLWRRLTFRDIRALRQGDRQRFEELIRESKFPGKPLCTVLLGNAGRAVLREARNWDADLIVMGVRRFKRLFPTRLGRTSRYVLRHGERSIVVVPT